MVNLMEYDVVLPSAGDRCICNSLQSIYAQTVEANQIIVIFDGRSPAECCESYMRFSKKVTYIRTSVNIGVAAIRNLGLGIVSSNYVAFIDDDDIWFPIKMERQLDLISKFSLDLIGTNARLSSKNGDYFNSVPNHSTHFSEIVQTNVFITSSVVASTRLMNLLKGFPTGLEVGEDYVVWILAHAMKAKCYFLAEPLLIYCDEGESLSRSTSKSAIEQKVDALRQARFTLASLPIPFMHRYLARHLLKNIIDSSEN